MDRTHISALSLWQTSALLRIFSCSLLVAVCAQVALPLPWSPVPITLQTLGVLLTGILLGPAAAAAALALYLCYGAAGLPLFAPTGPGGLAAFAGPTAGYLLSFPLAAALVSWLYRSLRARNHWTRVSVAGLAGIALVYFFGALWLSFFTSQTLLSVLPIAVYPFVPGDLAKIAAAAALSRLLVPTR